MPSEGNSGDLNLGGSPSRGLVSWRIAWPASLRLPSPPNRVIYGRSYLLQNQILGRIIECSNNHMLMWNLSFPVTSQLYKIKSHCKQIFINIILYNKAISMVYINALWLSFVVFVV